ncbi:MAG: hypothetical protein M3R04_03230 [bacterium]|nr:hypothetical protein [bacterium]
MALVKQTLPIALTALNQNVDEKNAPIGTMDVVENAYREQAGEFRKRAGSSVLGTTTDTGTITAGKYLTSLRDSLVLTTDTAIYQRNSALAKWLKRSDHVSYIASTFLAGTSAIRQGSADVAYSNGLLFFVWEEYHGLGGTTEYSAIYYAVIDASSGQTVVARTAITTAASPVTTGMRNYMPKVVAVGASVIIFYQQGDASIGSSSGTVTMQLRARKIANTAPGTVGTDTQVIANMSQPNPGRVIAYDVMSISGKVAIVYTATNYRVMYWLENMTVGTAEVDQGATGNVNAIAFMDHDAADGLLWIANGELIVTCNSTTLAAVDAFSNSGTLRQVTGYVSGGVGTILYDVKGTHAYNTVTWKRVSNGTPTEFMRSCGLASKVYKIGSNYTVNLAHESVSSALADSGQSQILVFDVSTAKVIGKPLPAGLGTGLPIRKGHLSSGAVISSTKVVVPITRKLATGVYDQAVNILPNVYGLTMEASDSRLSPPVVAADCIVFPGAQPKLYDGDAISEIGFHTFPEKPTTVDSGVGGMVAGTYTYRCVYEWTDAGGRLHRSQPSAASTALTVAVSRSITVTVGTLRVTDKAGVTIGVFREDGDGIYHRVGVIANVATADTTTFGDGMTITAASAAEILYTTGNVLPNDAPPACTIAGVARNRLWLGGVVTGELWHSKELGPDYGISFSDFLTLPEPDGETPTAIGEMDQSGLVFYEDSIRSITGDGPNDLGQGDYVDTKVLSGYGTTQPGNVAFTPIGAIYLSKDGWRNINRGMTDEPIGAPVQDYDTATYKGAVVLPKRSHVMFFSSGGRTVVYDWANQQWYTYTGQAAAAATIYGDVYAYVSSAGVVSYEVDGQSHDNSVAIATKYRLTWLNFGGLAAFQRIYSLQAVGEYMGAHTLRATWEFDHIATTYAYNVTPAANPYRFETRPPVQRCTAARVTIEEIVSGLTGGFRLSGLSALIGIKPGHKPVAAASRTT